MDGQTAREARLAELKMALGIVARWRETLKTYETSFSSCQCPDFRIRSEDDPHASPCAHQLAYAMLERR